MFKRHTTTALIFAGIIGACLAGIPVVAQNWVCSEDLDSDGDIDALSETLSCVPLGDPLVQFCGLNAKNCIPSSVEVCPIASIPCTAGFCATPAPCHHTTIDDPDPSVPSITFSTCPTHPVGVFTDDPAGCNAVCTESTACVTDPATTYTCPGDPGATCVVNGSLGYQCNTNSCYDLDSIIPVDTDFASDMLVNDGTTDAAGNCTALTYIFSGRPMDCSKAGVSTAFKNCCKETDAIYHDSLGTRTETQLASAAVTGTYTAMSAAYSAYTAAIGSGASTAVAADTAATAATDALIGAFDPTTLALSVAIALITEYLLSACDQTDLETAALRSSGYCVEVGEYCAKEWFGGCVQKAKAHCCFNSKLARIVHQQGRPQLNEFAAGAPNYFGAPEAPSCDGFTPFQFQSLDFSTIELGEYYDDLATDTLPAIHDRIEEGFNDYLEATGGGG